MIIQRPSLSSVLPYLALGLLCSLHTGCATAPATPTTPPASSSLQSEWPAPAPDTAAALPPVRIHAVPTGENYHGQWIAALVPFTVTQPNPACQLLTAQLSQQLTADLTRANVFALVTPVAQPQLPHEAEVFIDGVLDNATRSPQLRLRGRYQTTGRIGLERRYTLGAPSCEALTPTAIAQLSHAMSRDIQRQFARAPAY